MLVLIGYNVSYWQNEDYEYFVPQYRNKLVFGLREKNKLPVKKEGEFGFMLCWPPKLSIWG